MSNREGGHFEEVERSRSIWCPPAANNTNYPIIRKEEEAEIKSLKGGKSVEVDNIPEKFITCNKIGQTGK